MSLYSDYIREISCGREIIEIEGIAFATYFIHTDLKECYIEDMYIRPRYRNGGMLSKLLSDIERFAKEKGCTTLTHGVVKTHKKFREVRAISRLNGFKEVHETETEVYFAREIK
jgi:GNAT superfamily N-acetyltransferase